MEELQCAFREAKLAAALDECTAIVNGVVPTERYSTKLSPMITIPESSYSKCSQSRYVSRYRISILSLKFAMVILSQEQNQFKSVIEWKVAMQERLKSPDIVLTGYSGERLNVLAQLKVTISQGDYVVTVTALVQKDAPSPLLLGTDVLPSLGFSFAFQKPGNTNLDTDTQEERNTKGDTRMEDSVAQTDDTREDDSLAQQTVIPPVIELESVRDLCLAQTNRIPARCRKVVKAVLSTSTESCLPQSLGTLLFTPTCLQEGVVMADTVLSHKEKHAVSVIVENQNNYSVWLDKGFILGQIEPVEELEEGDEATATETAIGCIGATDNKERVSQFLEMLDLHIEHLSEDHQRTLKDLLVKHSDIFALNPTELGKTELMSHHIDTGDHPPTRQPLRRTPFSLRKRINEMVKEMLDMGIIKQSSSPWASPVVLVKKKDGTMRFCVDYRKLNHVTKPDVYPLPRIDDTLEQLAGAKYFSTLDMASGYWQVPMDSASQEKTAFSTYAGLYEFNKMPFGLVNAPATFQRLMEIALAGLTQDCCLTYLDDVLVIGRSIEEQNPNLVKLSV